MITRTEWAAACAVARRGGRITASRSSLIVAYRDVARRYPFREIEGLALE